MLAAVLCVLALAPAAPAAPLETVAIERGSADSLAGPWPAADGSVWVARQYGQYWTEDSKFDLLRVAKSGAIETTSRQFSGVASDGTVASAPDGSIWLRVYESGQWKLTHVDASGDEESFDTPGNRGISSLAVAPNSHVWATSCAGKPIDYGFGYPQNQCDVIHLTPNGELSLVPIPWMVYTYGPLLGYQVELPIVATDTGAWVQLYVSTEFGRGDSATAFVGTDGSATEIDAAQARLIGPGPGEHAWWMSSGMFDAPLTVGLIGRDGRISNERTLGKADRIADTPLARAGADELLYSFNDFGGDPHYARGVVGALGQDGSTTHTVPRLGTSIRPIRHCFHEGFGGPGAAHIWQYCDYNDDIHRTADGSIWLIASAGSRTMELQEAPRVGRLTEAGVYEEFDPLEGKAQPDEPPTSTIAATTMATDEALWSRLTTGGSDFKLTRLDTENPPQKIAPPPKTTPDHTVDAQSIPEVAATRADMRRIAASVRHTMLRWRDRAASVQNLISLPIAGRLSVSAFAGKTRLLRLVGDRLEGTQSLELPRTHRATTSLRRHPRIRIKLRLEFGAPGRITKRHLTHFTI